MSSKQESVPTVSNVGGDIFTLGDAVRVYGKTWSGYSAVIISIHKGRVEVAFVNDTDPTDRGTWFPRAGNLQKHENPTTCRKAVVDAFAGGVIQLKLPPLKK